jgi:hypothetical protein
VAQRKSCEGKDGKTLRKGSRVEIHSHTTASGWSMGGFFGKVLEVLHDEKGPYLRIKLRGTRKGAERLARASNATRR